MKKFLLAAFGLLLTASLAVGIATCAPHEHTFGAWEVVTSATCTEEGEERRACSGCGAVEARPVPALGHDYVYGVCTRCGEPQPPTDSSCFTFTEAAGGYAVAWDQTSQLPGEIVIPGDYNGKPVTQIADYAFDGCSGLKGAVIPGSVTAVGNRAFAGSGLTGISIPGSVASIGDHAFSDCGDLARVALGSGVASIGAFAFSDCVDLESIALPDSVAWIGEGAFMNCDGLADLSIPRGVSSIGAWTFQNCDGLKSVTVGSGVTSIGDHAFYRCGSLQRITVGSDVTSIGALAFSGCEGLESVYVDDVAAWCGIDFDGLDANPLYYAQELYLNGQRVTDLAIPRGVTSIGALAFSGCSSLQSVTIPGSVTAIGENAFYACEGLTSAVFESASGWSVGGEPIAAADLSAPAQAAEYLAERYCTFAWARA